MSVAGGARTTRQYLRAGLLQELRVHLVPVLLGGGVRLFEDIGSHQLVLETTAVIDSPHVTHLRFRRPR